MLDLKESAGEGHDWNTVSGREQMGQFTVTGPRHSQDSFIES